MPKITVDLSDKVALVTGGASGIGRGFALHMALNGAAVAVVDRDGPAAHHVAAEVTALGGQSLDFQADVTDAKAIETAVIGAIEGVGQLDFLFANAGVLGPANFIEITPDAKMIRLGDQYPLFYDRDLAKHPTRLGHEVALRAS